MQKFRPAFLSVLIILGAFGLGFVANLSPASAAVCTLKNITWKQSNAKNGDLVSFVINGQNCSLDKVTVKVMLAGGILSDSSITPIELYFPRAGSAGENQIIGTWPIAISDVSIFNSNLYLVANLNAAGAGTQVDSKTGDIPYLVVGPALNITPNVTITTFNITPRQINANEITKLTATFKAKVDTPTYLYTRCSQIQAVMLDDSGNEIYTQSPQSVSSSNADYSFDFEYQYAAKTDGKINLKGRLKCLVFGTSKLGATLPTSSPVCIAIGSGVCGEPGTDNFNKTVPAGKDNTFTFNITNPLNGGPNNLFDIIDIATKWLLQLSIPLAVLWIMYAGFLMLTAGDKPANFEKGKKVLTYTVLGLAIVFIGRGFITLIVSVIELGGSSPQTEDQTQTLPFRQTVPNSTVGDIGTMCSGNNDCNAGLICNGICQRKDGNIIGEACLKSANPSNCQSTACSTLQNNDRGTCVDNPTSAGSGGGTSKYIDQLTFRYNGVTTDANSYTISPGKVGETYSRDLVVANPVDPAEAYSWAIVDGALPPGLNLGLTGTNGRAVSSGVNGTPSKSGTYKVTIQALDPDNKVYGRAKISFDIKP